MQIAFLGAESSGKTALVELLSNTQGVYLSPDRANTAAVDVSGECTDKLTELFQSKIPFLPKRTLSTSTASPLITENNNKSNDGYTGYSLNGYGPVRDKKNQSLFEFSL